MSLFSSEKIKLSNLVRHFPTISENLNFREQLPPSLAPFESHTLLSKHGLEINFLPSPRTITFKDIQSDGIYVFDAVLNSGPPNRAGFIHYKIVAEDSNGASNPDFKGFSGEFFIGAHRYFEQLGIPIIGILANWTFGSNLQEYQTNIKRGWVPIESAHHTWTGRLAVDHLKYNKISIFEYPDQPPNSISFKFTK